MFNMAALFRALSFTDSGRADWVIGVARQHPPDKECHQSGDHRPEKSSAGLKQVLRFVAIVAEESDADVHTSSVRPSAMSMS